MKYQKQGDASMFKVALYKGEIGRELCLDAVVVLLDVPP